MKFDKLELVREDYEDARFGKVCIYLEPVTDKLVMSKTLIFDERGLCDQTRLYYEERIAKDFPHQLKVLGIEQGGQENELLVYFEYPNTDLFDFKDRMKDPKTVFQFLIQLLDFVIMMQVSGLVYGDLRPDFVFFDEETDSFKVIDHFRNTQSVNKLQLINIRKKFSLYCSPENFNAVIEHLKENGNESILKAKTDFDLYKSEVFSIGMLILRLFDERQQYRKIYNLHKKEFDINHFNDIKKRVLNYFSYDRKMTDLLKYVFSTTLDFDPNKRSEPIQLKQSLLERFGKQLSRSPGSLAIKNNFDFLFLSQGQLINSNTQTSFKKEHKIKHSMGVITEDPLPVEPAIENKGTQVRYKKVRIRKKNHDGKYFKLSLEEKNRLLRKAQLNYLKYFQDTALKIVNPVKGDTLIDVIEYNEMRVMNKNNSVFVRKPAQNVYHINNRTAHVTVMPIVQNPQINKRCVFVDNNQRNVVYIRNKPISYADYLNRYNKPQTQSINRGNNSYITPNPFRS